MICEDQAGYDVAESIRAQRKYQKDNGMPDFAPSSGICWSCGAQIYQKHAHLRGGKEFASGVSTEKAGSQLVTGCPHCHRSYCD